MSDNKLVNIIADALAEDAFGLTPVAACGRQASAVLAALRANNIAVVELPSDTIIPTGWGDDCLGCWPAPGNGDPVSAWPLDVYHKGNVALSNGDFMSATDARALAAALLAAADAAERAE